MRVLVTGGSTGIGRASAEAFAQRGDRVAIVARRAEPLRTIAGATGASVIVADVTLADDRARIVDQAAQLLNGRPDVVVHAAGGFGLARVAGDGSDLLERLWAVNVLAPYALTALTLPAMLQSGAGQHIYIGSIAGRQAFPCNGAYSATKFALRGLHAVLEEELHRSGVVVTLIEPAATDTPLWSLLGDTARDGLPPAEQMLRAAEVADLVLFAATRPRGVAPRFLAMRAER